MARDLASMECVPCRGGVPPLTHEEIKFPAEFIVPIGNDEFIGAGEDDGDSITQFIGDVDGHPRFIRSGYRLVARV